MNEKLRQAYQNLTAMLSAADSAGFTPLYWEPREDGKIGITSDGITYVVILERKQ
jgi:hypothetical protein